MLLPSTDVALVHYQTKSWQGEREERERERERERKREREAGGEERVNSVYNIQGEKKWRK